MPSTPLVFRLAVSAILFCHLRHGFGVLATITKCYDRLGCFDNAILNALPQEPAHIRTELRLSCAHNIDNATIKALDEESKWQAILHNETCLQVDRDTAFIIHGFRDNGDSPWVIGIRNFLVDQKDYNVFVVDWNHGAGFLYEQAAANTHLVARQMYLFINTLEGFKGLDPIRMHMIGHSLGAHIAGNTGHALAPYKVARITGLDPAEPYFEQFNDTQRLDRSDAIFVDVIHTDGERFTGLKGFGSMRPQGHVDFYPNGGQKQPGCQTKQSSGFFFNTNDVTAIACSHSRAHELFVQSLRASPCRMEARRCSSWQEFTKGNCQACPPEGCVPLGMETPPTSRGELYLSTASEEPFCGQTYLVELTTASDQGHSYGRLEVDILDTNTTYNHGFLGGGQGHFHESVTYPFVVTVPMAVAEVTDVTLHFVKGDGLSSVGTSDLLILSKVKVISFEAQRRYYG